MKSIISGIILFIVLIGCDPGATYEFNLHNETEGDLDVAYTSINFLDTTISIVGNTSKQLDSYYFFGGAFELDQEGFETYFSRITIKLSDSVIYESDPAKVDDWDSKREEGWMWSKVTYDLKMLSDS